MEHPELTPVGTLNWHDSKLDPTAQKWQVVQGPWQWVINNKLVAAAPLQTSEQRVIKTGRGQNLLC